MLIYIQLMNISHQFYSYRGQALLLLKKIHIYIVEVNKRRGTLNTSLTLATLALLGCSKDNIFI